MTQEHIDNGVAQACEACPIALAILDAIPRAAYCDVEADHVQLWFDVEADVIMDAPDREADMPLIAANFVTDFDAGRPVRPFEFELGVTL
ncbi:hypothetical protein K2Z84_21515 [Candidatus Binatia bacterium]|nr:hypothetical protein [Candidatus Binatia bacterium]